MKGLEIEFKKNRIKDNNTTSYKKKYGFPNKSPTI
jgi:hypothetical protein